MLSVNETKCELTRMRNRGELDSRLVKACLRRLTLEPNGRSKFTLPFRLENLQTKWLSWRAGRLFPGSPIYGEMLRQIELAIIGLVKYRLV